jgi:uroporphyrinogen decarboxylase
VTRRELFRATLEYGEHQAVPSLWWDPWEETRVRWESEGLPAGMDAHDYFGTYRFWINVEVDAGLFPRFPIEVLEETAELRILRDGDGVVQKCWKSRSGIPQYLDHGLKDAATWAAYRSRLQPDPRRIPADLREKAGLLVARDVPLFIDCGSLMGWIRNWMGLEGMAYLLADDRDCYADMVTTIADLVLWSIDEVAARLPAPPDLAIFWEDMCGSTGPLISPTVFREIVAPQYRRITSRLAELGVHLVGVDCDGDVRQLVGEWLDCGVNVQMPLEIGTWQGDPLALRRKYGRDLRIVGGIDKRSLAQGRAAIEAEIERRLPLAMDGGYIPMPDHYITPDTSLADFGYYLDRIEKLDLR